MGPNQLNNTSSEDIIAELLTLTCKVNTHGDKIYRNKEGKLHRIYGPAVITTNNEYEAWFKNGRPHRIHGPARIFENTHKEYWVDGIQFTKEQFIQWQKDNGITPNE